MKNDQYLTMSAATALLVLGAALLAGCGERPPVDTVQTGFRGTGMEQVYNPRLMASVAAANQLPPLLPAADSSGPRAAEVYQNVKVLTDLSVGEFTRVMLAMTQWVAPADQSCSYCHGANMADGSKYTYQVARRMLEMTRDINSNAKSHVGATGVTCFTCHHGQPVPAYTWFHDPGPQEVWSVGTRAGQNTPGRSVALSSLPYDPFSPFLLDAKNIRVGTTTALPSGNLTSIKQAEWTYGLMMHMSTSLGVNCTYCHNTRAWSDWSDSTPQRVTAWHGIQLTRRLNTEYLVPLTGAFPANRLGPTGDVAKINCQTCHRGVYKPLFGQSIAKDFPELQRARRIPAALLFGPTAAALPSDVDGDGIGDGKDACPDTPAGTRVGPMGCSCDLDIELTFATDSADLTAEDVEVLDYAVGVLKRLSWTGGVIEGHTDNTGTDEINIPLSERRAQTVQQWLLGKGIGDERMSTAGFGSARPIADNATAEGRALNRRVVLRRTDCDKPT